MTEIIKGGNLPLGGEPMRVAVVRRDGGPGSPAVDAAALLVGAGGKVRGRGDLVFYNQPEHAASAVRLLGDARGDGGVTADWLEIDPGRVEPSVERIVVAASCDGGTFGEVADLYLRAVSEATGEQLALYAVDGATTETAILLGEFYRRDGGWKFRAVGQGYASGLPGLAADFGFTVPEEPEEPEDREDREDREEGPAPAPFPDRLPLPPPLPEPAAPAVPTAVPAPPAFRAPPAESAPRLSDGVEKTTGPATEGPAATGPATTGPVPTAAVPGDVPSGRRNALPAEFGQEFPEVRYSGRGREIIEVDTLLPRGFVVVDLVKEAEGYVHVNVLDRGSDNGRQIMVSVLDDLRGRTVFRHGGKAAIRLEVDTYLCAWTITLRPVTVVHELDGRIEGRGPDVLAYSRYIDHIKVGNLGRGDERGYMTVHAVRNNDNRDLVFERESRGRNTVEVPMSPRLLVIDAPGAWSVEPTELSAIGFWIRNR
ncbi:TerD family protein [Streptomyces sp. NPDC002886]|uniref:TerD family protein n=1 Tax=Streptomyces sp. NPDC002886 TaxID=3364667 RepID=UPI003690F037